MAFTEMNLPPTARALFLMAQKAPPLWPAVVKESYRVGIKDLNYLTDIAFFVHHPERGGRLISPGEPVLAREWKAYRSDIEALIPAATKPTGPAKPVTPAAPTLLDLLRQVDTTTLGGNAIQRKHIARMKEFFIRGLEGDEVNDGYWQFSYFDGFGREHNCSEKHSVSSVGRGERPQLALANFKRNAMGKTTVGGVGRALALTESAVACHTFVLVRWAHQNAGTGDGSLRSYTEYGYLRAIAALAQRTHPQSVYWVYKDELVLTLGNIG